METGPTMSKYWLYTHFSKTPEQMLIINNTFNPEYEL